MRSQLCKTEFQNRLSDYTEDRAPIMLFIPLLGLSFSVQKKKMFTGQFDDKSFKLTLNKTFNPIPYVIKGTYVSADNNETAGVSVEYTVQSVFALWYKIVSTCIALLMLSTAFFLAFLLGGLCVGIPVCMGVILLVTFTYIRNRWKKTIW